MGAMQVAGRNCWELEVVLHSWKRVVRAQTWVVHRRKRVQQVLHKRKMVERGLHKTSMAVLGLHKMGMAEQVLRRTTMVGQVLHKTWRVVQELHMMKMVARLVLHRMKKEEQELHKT